MSQLTPPKLSLPALKKGEKRKRSLSNSGQQPLRTQIPNPALSRSADRSTPEATASFIAHSLATSVATPTLNVTPSHLETTPRGHLAVKDAIVNVLKLLLNILSDIPGLGTKAALSGLLTSIERVQVCETCDCCEHWHLTR